jgi:hypothetical protein
MTDEKAIYLIPVSEPAGLTKEFKAIYEEAFPPDERRDWRHMSDLLNNTSYSLRGIYYQQKLIGLISIWNLQEFRFIEHFAIRDYERGKGFGSKVIQQIISESAVPVILEVEEPNTEIARKRIDFYERLDFLVCEAEYFQPPYSTDKSKVKMQLMSYPEKIKDGDFPLIKSRIYWAVYGIIE